MQFYRELKNELKSTDKPNQATFGRYTIVVSPLLFVGRKLHRIANPRISSKELLSSAQPKLVTKSNEEGVD